MQHTPDMTCLPLDPIRYVIYYSCAGLSPLKWYGCSAKMWPDSSLYLTLLFMRPKQFIFLIFLLQAVALLGCSSGGSGSSGDSAAPSLPGFTLEEIPSATAPTAKAMSKQDASVVAMQLLRLYSWEAHVSTVNHDGSNHYTFLPYNVPPGVSVGGAIVKSGV